MLDAATDARCVHPFTMSEKIKRIDLLLLTRQRSFATKRFKITVRYIDTLCSHVFIESEVIISA